ncbi:hypothetical protein GCM10009430_07290 [Aquimarina litoralis]|uniref:O-antigen ligase-related domain-containing protein n=1 Tax=Aquimarina litoralis TaxID=584605 RepID=A0ABN1II54_9FLAO
MKRNIFNKEKAVFLSEKVPFFLFCFICLLPILEVTLVSKGLLFFFATGILLKYKTGFKNLTNIPKKHLIINVAFYVLLIITILYSFDTKQGSKAIVRQLSLFLFPFIIFYFLDLSKKQIIQLAKVFVFANVISSLYLIIYVINYYGIDNIDGVLSFYSGLDFRSAIETDSYKEWHPAYIGAFIMASILILIHGIYSTTSKKVKLSNVGLIVFFISMLLLLNSRTAFYSLIIITPIQLLLETKSLKNKIVMFLVYLVCIGVLGYFVVNEYSLYYRLLLQIEKAYDWLITGEILEVAVDPRYYIYQCNYELFLEKPWLGYGIGDIQYNLNNCYLDNEYFKLYNNEFNSHSNYFFLLLSGGILILGSFLFLIIHNIRHSIRNKDYLFFSFLILFLLVGISESFLVRLNGILFFSIFNSVLYYRNQILKKQDCLR